MDNIIRNYDIIHIHGLWFYPQYIVSKSCKRNQKEYIITIHGMLQEWFFKKITNYLKYKIHLNILGKTILNNANVIHSITAIEKQNIQKFTKTNILVIPNGIKSNNTIMKKNEHKDYFLFLGRVHPVKGVELLLNTWKKNYISYGKKLIIAGPIDSDFKHKIYKIIDNKPNLFNIEFIGPVYGSEKERLLNECRAFILPTLSEVISIANLEAMSHSKPIITTYLTGLKKIDKVKAGLMINPNEAELNHAIGFLSSCSEKILLEMGSEAFKLVQKHYNITTINQQLVDLYKKVAHTNSEGII